MNARSRVFLAMTLLIATSTHAQPPRRLDTIRVAARAPEPALALARSTEVIDRAELEKRAGHDLSDVLAASLGLDVFRRSPAQADLSIRGSSFNQIVILVDGIRVSDAQSGHYNMDLAVPMASIERIEILRGGGSALYGADAIGGVVNIVTRRAAPSSLSVHAGTFNTSGGGASSSLRAGPATVSAAVDQRDSRGHREGTDYDIWEARGGATSRVGAGTLALDAGIGIRHFGAADFYGAYPSFEDTRTVTAATHYDRPLPREWTLNASADVRRHYDLYTLNRSNPALYQNRHLSWQRGGRAVATGRIGRVVTALGGEGLFASLESARLGDHDEKRGAGFTELSVGSPSATIAMVGTRVDWSSRTGTFVSPGASLVTAVSQSLRLRASASRGFRAPTWTETYYSDPANVANPDLKPETFDMAELGARMTPGWGWIDGALFIRRGEELIDWTKPAATPTAQWRSTNLESATFRGVEGEVGVADVAGLELRLRAAGLRFSSSDADTLIGKYALSPITESAFIQATTPFISGLRVSVNSGRARRAREEAYWRTDLRVTARIRGSWVGTLDGLNVTSADYRDASAKPVAGKLILLGLRR